MHAHSRLRYSDRRRPLRGLIFDMDGTIADTRDYHMLAWRRLVEIRQSENLSILDYPLASEDQLR